MSYHARNHDLIANTVRRALRRPAAAVALITAPGIAFAGPTGENVIRGNATVTRPDDVTTVIDQYTQRAAIDWWTFNVEADEFVIFNQPDASSIVLNRVLGGDPSYIFGQIMANGQVFLLNPQGVFFAPNASIDVQGFLASTLTMDPDDFMAGNYMLARAADAPANASVVNQGDVTAGPGGYVLFAGDFVENTGVITANAGSIALVSGNQLTLDLEGDGLVNFSVDEATLSDAAGVRNAGSLIANGGMVVMTAQVASDLVTTAVNNEGLVQAHSIENRAGEIYLVGFGGDVENSGTLDADGVNADGGGIIIYSDKDVTLVNGAVQTAAADENHTGGTIRAIAEDHLDYQQDNLIRVTGGASGGFVEVSGHGSIALRGTPEIGAGGDLLIDPNRVEIRIGGAATLPSFSTGTASVSKVTTGWIANQLENGVDVTLVANQSILYTDTLSATIGATGSGNLDMIIGNVSSLNGAGTYEALQGILTDGPPTITPVSGGTINISGLSIEIAGDVSLTASNGNVVFSDIATAGNVNIVGGSITGNFIGSGAAGTPGSVSVTASGSYPANITLSSYVVARNNISLTANAFGPSDGNINVGGVLTTTDSISGDITISASGGYSNGGDVNIMFSGSAAGAMSINASGGPGGGGNITVGGNGPKGLTANAITLNAYASNNSAGTQGGKIDINGQVQGGSGSVNITALNTGSGPGGSIQITGALGANGDIFVSAGAIGSISGANIDLANVSGNNVSITANGNTSFSGLANLSVGDITATGNVLITGDYGSNHVFGDINARHIDAHFTPTINGSVSVTMGALSVNGTVSANRDIVIGLENNTDAGPSGSSSGNLTIGGATAANGEIIMQALNFASSGAPVTGNVTVNGTINAARFVRINAPDDVTTRAIGAGSLVDITTRRGSIATRGITVSNTNRTAAISLHAGTENFGSGGADVTVDGNINVSGRATVDNPFGAHVDIRTPMMGNAITVTGGISLTAAPRAYSNLDANSSGSQGIGAVNLDAGMGVIDAGNIIISADGSAFVDGRGTNISVGDISITVADGNFTETESITSCGTVSCNLVQTFEMTNGSRAEIRFSPLSSGSGLLSFGDVNVTAGDAHLDAWGFGSIKGGGINMDATGVAFSVTSTGTYDSAPVNFSESGNGGGATVSLETSGSGTATLNGAVNLTGKGQAALRILADTINVRGISATAAGGTFTRSGQMAGPHTGSDGPFGGGGGGPDIDQGTVIGGGAHIVLGGYSFSTTGGAEATASAVNVNGGLSVSAPGAANIEIFGRNVTVSGALSAVATRGQQNGSYERTYFDSAAGSSVTEAGTVSTSFGTASILIEQPSGSPGNVQLGNVTLGGPGIGGHIAGNNVRMGSLTLTGSGGSIDVQETRTYAGGTTEYVSFQGAGFTNGMGVSAVNALEFTGDINIDAVGVGGVILEGASISTRNINIAVASADYSVKAPQFGGTQTSFTLGEALLAFAGGIASVNGSINIQGVTEAHFAGQANVSGDFNAQAGTGFTRTITDRAQFLNAIDDGDGSPLSIPSTLGVSADNIRIASSSGPMNLNAATLNASNAIKLETGGNMSVTGVNFSAATITMQAGGNITNALPPGSITADALAIIAGGNIGLGSTAITVGNGSIAGITGDTVLLSLLATQDVDVTADTPNLFISGNNVALGNIGFGGDYLFLQANTLAFTGTVNTSDPNLLVQLTPRNPNATMTLEDSAAGSGNTNYTNTTHLAWIDGATIALGTTTHQGNVDIGANGEIGIGSSNLFVLTNGTVKGLDKVLSTGIVNDLAGLRSGNFDVPQTDEIDTSQDTYQQFASEYELEASRSGSEGEDEDEGEEEGEDTDDDTVIEEDEDSLIRQDTVDEELVCT